MILNENNCFSIDDWLLLLFNSMSIFLIKTTNILMSFWCDKMLNEVAFITAMLTKLFLYDLLSICFFFNKNSILINLSSATDFLFCFVVNRRFSFFFNFAFQDACWSSCRKIAFDKNFAKIAFLTNFDFIFDKILKSECSNTFKQLQCFTKKLDYCHHCYISFYAF